MATRFRLRELADKAGVSQSELSRRSGVSFATINRMCTNSTGTVALETLDRLADALCVEPGALLERTRGTAQRSAAKRARPARSKTPKPPR